MKRVSVLCKKPAPAPGDEWGELYKILHTLLERRHYLLPFIKEFNFIENTLKSYLEDIPAVSIGAYKIEGFYRNEDVYLLPPHLKAKYCKKEKIWSIFINKKEGR